MILLCIKEQKYLIGRWRPAAKDNIIIPLTQPKVALVQICPLAVIGLIAKVNGTTN